MIGKALLSALDQLPLVTATFTQLQTAVEAAHESTLSSQSHLLHATLSSRRLSRAESLLQYFRATVLILSSQHAELVAMLTKALSMKGGKSAWNKLGDGWWRERGEALLEKVNKVGEGIERVARWKYGSVGEYEDWVRGVLGEVGRVWKSWEEVGASVKGWEDTARAVVEGLGEERSLMPI